jgi:hypothetical protein
MRTDTEMKRSNALRKEQQHIPEDPFCAVHPDLAAHKSSIVQSEPDEPRITLRRSEPAGPRAHVRAEHVVTARKKK